jgi:hypothetical protein
MNIGSITSQSLSAATSGSTAATGAAGGGTFKNLWAQVGYDLNKGNLTGAQTAFAQIKTLYQQNHPGGTGSTGSGSSPGPLRTDIVALGQALNSNSLTASQAAFNQLQQDARAAGVIGGGSQSASVLASSSTANLLNVLA